MRIRKGAKPSDAYFQFWLPLRDLTPNKQEQFTPEGREPSELLALGVNVSGIRIERDKSRKLKYLKVRTGTARNSIGLIKMFSIPFGEGGMLCCV